MDAVCPFAGIFAVNAVRLMLHVLSLTWHFHAHHAGDAPKTACEPW